MATGGARRGRRDNGLDAAEYAVVADVDPRVGEHLLDVLAVGGIAAYLQPASDLNPVTRTTTVPARPTDRLYVDRAHLQTARDYVDRLSADEATSSSPGAHPAGAPTASQHTPATPDIDAEWARLMASYDDQIDPESRPWPAAEHLDVRTAEPTAPAPESTRPAPDPTRPPDLPAAFPPDFSVPSARTIRPADADEPSLLDGLDTFGADLPDEPDPEEGYTPPPPPPLPRISKYAVAAVLAIVTGFVLFVFPTLLPLDSDITMLLGFTAILTGFGTLILRLRPGDSDDDADPDDGAVV